MNDKNFQRDIAHQLKIISNGCEDEIRKLESLLPCPIAEWKTLNLGHINQHPATAKAKPSIQMNDGRTIQLVTLYQFESYAGFLEGTPHPYVALLNALNAAKEHFKFHSDPPAFIPPTLRRASYGYDKELEYWLAVPDYCSIGLFQCDIPVNDTNETFSLAIIIWFQDEMGLDLDAKNLSVNNGYIQFDFSERHDRCGQVV